MIKIEGVGNLGSEPTLNYVGDDQKPVTRFRVYLNSARRDAEGNHIDRGDWFGVSVWGPCAESAAKLLHKGDSVYVQGTLGTDRWPDKETGEERSAPKIDANLVLPYLPFVESVTYQPRKGAGDQAAAEHAAA